MSNQMSDNFKYSINKKTLHQIKIMMMQSINN